MYQFILPSAEYEKSYEKNILSNTILSDLTVECKKSLLICISLITNEVVSLCIFLGLVSTFEIPVLPVKYPSFAITFMLNGVFIHSAVYMDFKNTI